MNPSADPIRKRKSFILLMGIILFFFTSMSKMLVPGPIYNQLLFELHFDPPRIAAFGAFFMYAYAASQLLMAIYSARYGGVRILLIGGSLFTVGTLGFPLCSDPWLMYGFRVLAGFGAGTVFLGIAKLISDLYPLKFGLMLGIALLIGYLGPVTGTVPLVWLISRIGWRPALFLPGAVCLLAMAGILLTMRGTIRKTVSGQSFRPLWTLLKNRPMLLLCFSSALIFGIYYVLLTQVGQKCFEDSYGLDKFRSSLCITMLSVVVAVNNVIAPLLLKWIGGRRKTFYCGGSFLLMAGCLSGWAALRWQLPVWVLIAAFLLIAIPGGFFSFYSIMAKELNPPEVTGLAVAVLNFSAFACIALFGNLSGSILNCWKDVVKDGIFPRETYAALFAFLTVSAILSALLGFLMPAGAEKKNSV